MIRRAWTSATALRATACALALALCAASAGAAQRKLPSGPSTTPMPVSQRPPALRAAVLVALDEPLARFSPMEAIGGGLDGREQGEIAQIYTPSNLKAMSAAGLGAVTYRLRTELGVQAWHFDQEGHFSDEARHEGYWTGAFRPSIPAPKASFGYDLPRRGDTIDQADDKGYSRIDDGDPRTFWKSNPYLDSHFTGEPEGAHPQWVVIDLGRLRPVDALRIDWEAPYAKRFRVQRFIGPSAIMLAGHPPGHWEDFPHGSFESRGNVQTLRLSRTPVTVRFVRVLMYESSHTAPPENRRSRRLPGVRRDARGVHHARDIRDRLGYAIREIELGALDSRGRLRDLLVHRPSKSQSLIYTSSTDPWHTAEDLNRNYEQPSFQTVLSSGLTHGRPLLVPVSLLYGTPENAVAELRYLRALRVPIRGVELGEEPDGQLASPEDYGALYLQFARAIHRVFPHLPLGGPGFQTSIPDWLYWPDAHGDRSWTHRFIDYLKAHGALDQLSFFSFEWYPYDNVCGKPAGQLAQASDLLKRTLALQRAHGLPAGLPVYVSEYGYSAFAGQDEVDMPGALLDADTVGTLLESGVQGAYMYGYEPDMLLSESEGCSTWGNLTLLQSNEEHRDLRRLASFWETRMLTHDWVIPGDGSHTIYATSSSATDGEGHELVRAYALRRPDGRLSLLLLNMSPSRPYDVSVRLAEHLGGSSGSGDSSVPGEPSAPGRSQALSGPVEEWQLSSADYRWKSAGENGRPVLDNPPIQEQLPSGSSPVTLPPYSITVLRGGPG